MKKPPQLIRKNTAWRNALGKANHNSFHLFGGLWIHELCFHKRIIKNTLCISHREIKCTKWLASAVVNPIHKDYQRGSAYLRNTLQHLDNYHSTPSHSSILMKKPLTDDRELSKIVITLFQSLKIPLARIYSFLFDHYTISLSATQGK